MIWRLSLVLLMCGPAMAAPDHAPWPGGVAVLHLYSLDRPLVTVDEQQILVLRESDTWVAVIGIPLEHAAPGLLQAGVKMAGVDKFTVLVDIRENAYQEQRLSVDRKYVEPSQQQLDRIFSERKIIDAALNSVRDVTVAKMEMSPPVSGRRSSSFGLRRFFNGQPRSPHKGMDIASGEGTPVAAPLAGRVTATGDFYFNGNTVIVDHGQGFVTLYCHLSRIMTEEGNDVTAGTIIGAVGATGRVTGPHLHFATYLGGTAVDPALFLPDSG